MSDPSPSPSATPSGTPSASAGAEAVEALQLTLAAEHAAVFVYAALGAQTSRSAAPTLYRRITAAYRLHRTRRDQLDAMLRDAGAEPDPAAPGYALPADLSTTRLVTARARRLEQDAARTYAYLVARSTGPARTWAVTALLDAATRGLGFGGRPEDFPGR